MTIESSRCRMHYRLTYTRNALLAVLAEYPYATTTQLYQLMRPRMKRAASKASHERNVRAILRNATLAGFVARAYPAPKPAPNDLLALASKPTQPYCYYLAAKGSALLGLRAGTGAEKTPYSLAHEQEITQYHIALVTILGDRLKWKQTDIRRTVNPDALFAIRAGAKGHWFFLEIEKSRQGNQRGGKSGLQRKCERYDRFRGSEQCRREYEYFRDFRVVIVFTSGTRQMNFLRKLCRDLPYRWIWTTNETDYGRDPGGAIYLTPKDFETTSYSLLGVSGG